LLGGRNLVPNALARHFAFKLGKRQQDVQGQATHRACGIKLLGYGDEGYFASIEPFNDPGKICKGAGKTINFINNQGVYFAGINVFEHALQCRSVDGAARVAAVIVMRLNEPPALMLLARNVCIASFALSVKGIESLLKPLL
jgi:hypothetical protein